MDDSQRSDLPYALAFETSSLHGSIALGRGRTVIATRPFSGPRRHATDFLPTIDATCRESAVSPGEVRRVFVSIGPGSFTGLRIGITAARILGLANGASVVGVPSLEVIAQNAATLEDPPPQVAVILDAKRRRVYAATFELCGNSYKPLAAACETDPAAFLGGQPADCAVMGQGVLCHREVVEEIGLRVLPESLAHPRAEVAYRLGHARAEAGQTTPPRELAPLYIRPPEAEERWEKRHGSDTAS